MPDRDIGAGRVRRRLGVSPRQTARCGRPAGAATRRTHSAERPRNAFAERPRNAVAAS